MLTKAELKGLSRLLRSQDHWRLVVLGGLMIIAALAEAFGIALVGFFTSLISSNQASLPDFLSSYLSGFSFLEGSAVLIYASLVLVLFFTAKNLYVAVVNYVLARITNGVRARMAVDLLSAYQKAPYLWHQENTPETLQRNIILDTNQVTLGIIRPLLDLVLNIVIGLFICAVVFMAADLYTLVALVFLGAGMFLVLGILRGMLQKTAEVIRAEDAKMIGGVQQSLSALIDSRVYGVEDHFAAFFRRAALRYARSMSLRQTIMLSTPLAIELIAIMGIVVLVMTVVQASSLQQILPELSIIALAILKLKQVASRGALAINEINASQQYLQALLADLRKAQEWQKDETAAVTNLGNFESLYVERAVFRYPEAATNILNDLSISLQRGEKIALVGTTGCGKSSVLSLIVGLFSPQQGQIKVNGKTLESCLTSWRSKLGFVQQTVFLVNDTIKANVCFGVPEAEIDVDRLQKVIEQSELKDLVDSLPEGLNSAVGDRGTKLSGGQKQRIGLARALYREPEVLIMDEATSALDNLTEAKVTNTILTDYPDVSMLIVAHRLTTVKTCDRIYFLDQGRVLASGSYEGLLSDCQEFAHLAQKE